MSRENEGFYAIYSVGEKVMDKFNFSEKRNVKVKGYTRPVEAYVVLSKTPCTT